MKRSTIIWAMVAALAIAAVIMAVRPVSLTDEERQQRSSDYALLQDALQTVGYGEENFALKETNTLEANLRRLWRKENAFNDPQKNAELLALLKPFDFIAEGLEAEDSAYKKAHFSHEEVLWLLLLLPEEALPASHPGLGDALMARGEDAMLLRTDYNIWPYFEKNYPGYLAQLDPEYWAERVSQPMAAAFLGADEAVQDRFMQAVNMEKMKSNIVRPRLDVSLAEAEALMAEYPPQGRWNNGYIRIVEPEIEGNNSKHPAATSPDIYEYRSGRALAAVTHPADARFAIYEEYGGRVFYATYSPVDDVGKPFDVYLWRIRVRIVDLLTGEEIFNEKTLGNLPPEEISISSMLRGVTLTADGEYNYGDFDYERYAEVILAYLE